MNLCGAKTKRGTSCKRPSGAGTDHVGTGKCKHHGGATPIKTGRYSRIQRPALAARISEFSDDPDPLNLEPEVALLRAIVSDLAERWDAIYGADGALLAWHESFKVGEDEGKPRQLPDFSSISSVVRDIGSLVDRIHKHKQTGTISLSTLNRVVEQLGEEVVVAVREAIKDETQRTSLLNAIESRWGSIRLEPDSAGR